jgi:hypothetical protein
LWRIFFCSPTGWPAGRETRGFCCCTPRSWARPPPRCWGNGFIRCCCGSHLAIDAGKTYLTSDGLRSFLLDQGLHLAAVLAGAIAFPGAVPDGLWFQVLADAEQRAWLLRAATVASGLILCLPVGGILVSKTVKPLLSAEQFHQMKGVPNGGRIIGYLERSLVMLLIWIGLPGHGQVDPAVRRHQGFREPSNHRIRHHRNLPQLRLGYPDLDPRAGRVGNVVTTCRHRSWFALQLRS